MHSAATSHLHVLVVPSAWPKNCASPAQATGNLDAAAMGNDCWSNRDVHRGGDNQSSCLGGVLAKMVSTASRWLAVIEVGNMTSTFT